MVLLLVLLGCFRQESLLIAFQFLRDSGFSKAPTCLRLGAVYTAIIQQNQVLQATQLHQAYRVMNGD